MDDGLADFGTGAFQGGATGAAIGSYAGPYGTAIGAGVGALAGGALSYFGGAQDRRDRARNNKNEFALQDLQISEAKRARELELQRQRRMKQFGQLLGQYFQKQGGK